MPELTDEQQARALGLRNHWADVLGGVHAFTLGPKASQAWHAVAEHVLATHTCQPVWRPTTREEIQPGWEIRSRTRGGPPQAWGRAHHQDSDGDWRTEAEDTLLTFAAAGWPRSEVENSVSAMKVAM